MSTEANAIVGELWQRGKWIAALALVVAALSIGYLALTEELHLHMVIATLGGVFLTVLIGCGLMAATFFSDTSGHDAKVSDATKP